MSVAPDGKDKSEAPLISDLEDSEEEKG